MWSPIWRKENVLALGALFAALIVALSLSIALTASSASAADGPTPDIVGGTEVPDDPDLWPFIVAILDSSDPESQFCGGALVAPSWVLTTRTCAEAATSLHVLVGRKSLSGTGGAVIKASKSIFHSGFDDELFANNLAMIRLSQPAPSPAAPITLAGPSDVAYWGDELLIAGWGSTDRDGLDWPDTLQEATVTVTPNCPEFDGNWGPSFCAAHFEGANDELSRDICFGDLGGPAIRIVGDEAILMGIANWGLECATSPYASVWVDVHSTRAWIQDAMTSAAVPDVGRVVFDPTLVGASNTRTVVVRNWGDQSVTMGSAWVTGAPNWQNFEVVRNTCDGQPTPPGGTCEIDVRFAPTAWPSAVYEADLNISSTKPDLGSVVKLSGAASGRFRSETHFGISFPKRASKVKWAKRGRKASGIVEVRMWRSEGGGFRLPTQSECAGSVKVTTKLRGVKKSIRSTANLTHTNSGCMAPIRLTVPLKPKRLLATFKFDYPGNTFMLPASTTYKRRIR